MPERTMVIADRVKLRKVIALTKNFSICPIRLFATLENGGTFKANGDLDAIAMNTQINQTINTQLVDSLVQVILALSTAERLLLEDKLFGDTPYPSTSEISKLAETSAIFSFLNSEPDLYTFDDGEPI
jgi:hypothetical protein